MSSLRTWTFLLPRWLQSRVEDKAVHVDGTPDIGDLPAFPKAKRTFHLQL